MLASYLATDSESRMASPDWKELVESNCASVGHGIQKERGHEVMSLSDLNDELGLRKTNEAPSATLVDSLDDENLCSSETDQECSMAKEDEPR